MSEHSGPKRPHVLCSMACEVLNNVAHHFKETGPTVARTYVGRSDLVTKATGELQSQMGI